VIRQRGIDAAVKQLGRMSKGLRGLSSGKEIDGIADKMQRHGQRLLRDVFRTSTQPDGTPMVPLAIREGKPLVLTGALSSGARAVVVGSGPNGIQLLFEVPDTGDVKAIWHQKGTFRGGPTTDPRRAQNRKSFRAGEKERQHIPPRKMLPETAAEAGPWLSALDQVGQTELDRILRRLAF
jgi:hypothetical protein